MPEVLDQLFYDARSFSQWQQKSVTEAQVRQLYDLTKMGPTAFNACPARFVFCHSDEARQQLSECVMEGNVKKTQSAPLVVIVGMDLDFADRLPELWPVNPDVKNYFTDPESARNAAFRNSSLQGAYLMMAARAMGLDCGPMSGFDAAKVDETFFNGTNVKANFICAIGYGDRSALFPRGPRLSFDDAASLV